jgi:hypothetical protein
LTPTGILLDGFVMDLNKTLKLVNCYGPYGDIQLFWDFVKMDGLLKDHDLLLGGDLNFTLSTREVWGTSSRIDPLETYFNQLLQEEGLIDVEPMRRRGGEIPLLPKRCRQ